MTAAGGGRGRVAVLVNPMAGGGKARRLWKTLRREVPAFARLQGRSILLEHSRQDAEEALVEALEAGVERLVVVGGDGTFSLAADVIAVAGAGRRVVLGLVPAGTGSDLARSLALPGAPHAAAQQAVEGPATPLDALELAFDDGRLRFAVNVISAGVSGGVDERVAALEHRGKAAYLAAALRALLTYRSGRCRIEADGEPWHEGEILLFAVANGTSFGSGMRIAPNAKLDDGLADLVLAPRVPGWQLPILLPRLYLGRHLDSRHVRHRRAQLIRLVPEGDFPAFDLDGDPCPAGAVTITVRPGALRTAAPIG